MPSTDPKLASSNMPEFETSAFGPPAVLVGVDKRITEILVLVIDLKIDPAYKQLVYLCHSLILVS